MVRAGFFLLFDFKHLVYSLEHIVHKMDQHTQLEVSCPLDCQLVGGLYRNMALSKVAREVWDIVAVNPKHLSAAVDDIQQSFNAQSRNVYVRMCSLTA
jgi:hypothetical protein